MGTVSKMRKNAGFFWNIFSMLLGMVIIYSLGSIQLAVVAKMSFNKALAAGVLPFLPGDVIKILLAAVVCEQLKGKIKV